MLDFRSRRRGATLIDLLVPTVLYIIMGIILIPVFGRARQNARRATCQSHLKQIVMAVAQYVRDNEGYYPAAVRGEGSRGWADTIRPYVKSSDSYQCPEEGNGGSDDPASPDYVDYWYNPALSWNGKHGAAARWNASFGFDNESQIMTTVMLGDAGKVHGLGTATSRCNGYECSGNAEPSSPSAYAAAGKVNNQGFGDGGLRHLEGLNIAFADGHVKWFRSTGADGSSRVYNLFTPLKVSGSEPTFNLKRE